MLTISLKIYREIKKYLIEQVNLLFLMSTTDNI